MKNSLFFVFILFIMFSCGPSRILTNRNLSFLYDEPVLTIETQAHFCLINDTIGQVSFKINSRDLLYVKQDSSGKFEAKFQVTYTFYKSYESKEIIDSGKYIYKDFSYQIGEKSMINSFNVHLKKEKQGILELNVKDLVKQTSSSTIIEINITQNPNNQYFKCYTKDGISVFNNYTEVGKELKIQTFRKDLKKIFVKYYTSNFPIALPPYSIIEEKPYILKPDSIWQIDVSDGEFYFNFKKLGIYYFQADTALKSGMTMSVYKSDFPEITLMETALAAMRYLTTKQEFDKITENADLKVGMDNFWLNIAGNPDRAREIIREYYSNVKKANEYFTSYIEGWKTDRGIIYIIFGAPNVVYRTSDSEIWIYGEQFNSNSLTFKFFKIKNPFTSNDYMLSRSPLYKQNWFNAVEMWRR
ncbi:MAG: GWxTD domain-containing protein [Bacteroidota bacterium]